MRKVFYIIMAMFLVVAVAGSAGAAEKVKIKQYTGEVVTIDATAKSLTVKGKKAEIVFTADEKTTVKVGKEKKSLTDVKIGDKVVVKYSEVDGKNLVRSIEVKPEKTEKKGPESAKPAEPAKPAAKPAEPAKPVAKPKTGGY